VIRANVGLGNCWPAVGSSGWVTVQLSESVVVESVLLEHVHRVEPAHTTSAPKDFEVWSITPAQIEQSVRHSTLLNGTLLGSFTYDTAGPWTQTFRVSLSVNSDGDQLKTQFVQLRLVSNHGHAEYTCVYRFQVHGHPVSVDGG